MRHGHVARVITGSFVTASTSFVDVTGFRWDGVVPDGPFTVRAAIPTVTVEELNADAQVRIVAVQDEVTSVVAGDRGRADQAGDSFSFNMAADLPNFGLAFAPGSPITFKVQVQSSAATSDVTIWSGDFFGTFLQPALIVTDSTDRPDKHRASILRGYTGTSDVVVYEGDVNETLPPVVMVHGGGAGATTFQFQDQDLARIPAALTAAGFRVFEPALPTSPVAGCGNAAAVTALTNLRSWIITNYDYASAIKVGFVGLSMGMVEALAWGWRNPTLFAGAAGVIPGTNVDSLHVRNPLGATATINAAYSNDWAGNRSARDPHLNAASILPLGDRICMWHSNDDTAALQSEVIEDARAWKARTVSLGANGHWIGTWDANDLAVWASTTFKAS